DLVALDLLRGAEVEHVEDLAAGVLAFEFLVLLQEALDAGAAAPAVGLLAERFEDALEPADLAFRLLLVGAERGLDLGRGALARLHAKRVLEAVLGVVDVLQLVLEEVVEVVEASGHAGP